MGSAVTGECSRATGGQGWVASAGCTLSPCPWPPGDRGDKVSNHHFPLSTFKSLGPGFRWEHEGVSGCPQPRGDGAKMNLIWGNHQPDPGRWRVSLWLASTASTGAVAGFPPAELWAEGICSI